MRKLLLTFLFIGSMGANAQTTIFEDSFETYADFVINNFGAWNGIDTDLLTTYTGGAAAPTWDNANDPQAFQIFNPSIAAVTNINVGEGTPPSTENRNFNPRTGLKYAACWAAVPSTTGGPTANNDWLISPPITLGTSGNVMSVWVKSMSSTYGLERYRVGIFVGSTVPTASQFIFLAGSPVALTAPFGTWEERVISSTALNAYNGQTVRFGIQCVTADAYMFMVDDFKVTTTGLSNSEFSASKFSTYPNPAIDFVTVSNSENILVSEVAITDINGRTVSTLKVNNVTEAQINVSELNSGIYFMNITSDAGKVVKKFIKN